MSFKPMQHTSFGKYTLFSAYASTANMTMAVHGFAILFGNEDKNNWTMFWKFIKNTHTIVNLNNKTIITDQDKGSAWIKDIIPEAALFHCSFHRCQYIIKRHILLWLSKERGRAVQPHGSNCESWCYC
jgi:hypothetical protein